MARISPTPGSPITFSDILNKMGLSNSNRSFDAVEVLAMGGTTVSDMSTANSICMPYQLEAVANLANGGVGAPNANWSHLPGITNWRPVRMSEFRNAYNNKPQVSGSSDGTGNQSSCTVTINGSNSDAYTGSGTPYYFLMTGSGTFTGDGVWTIATSNAGQQRVYNVSSLNPVATGTWTIKVQDWEGCGNDGKITTTVTY